MPGMAMNSGSVCIVSAYLYCSTHYAHHHCVELTRRAYFTNHAKAQLITAFYQKQNQLIPETSVEFMVDKVTVR